MTTVPPVRVLIVEDHAIVRAGLGMLLGTRTAITVVGEAADCASAVAAAGREQPDIVLLDLDLGGVLALDSLKDLRAAAPGARVLILTGAGDPELHQLAVTRGASGLVLKQHAAETLLKAIEKVHAGEVWFGRSLMAATLSRAHEVAKPDPESAKIATLTRREREIIALIGEGLNNRHIAARLFISETTVRHHLTSIFAKLEVGDRLELVIYAFRHGLIPPPS
jgi:two-component system, NarL family, nitrate/nitrite response regulator NarL